jgi:uncharacterized protein YjdB
MNQSALRLKLFAIVSLLLLATLPARVELTLNKSSLSLEVGSGERLEASGEKSDAAQWSSSDTSVARVYKNGFVVALHPGSAKISARSESARATECQVSVKDAM